ncbi:MAG: putative non-heme bromoperoxidase BpoC [Chlamydiia bacterium]|nr:putative non-heme bromoperoxidase BpoC [Chlamydiia bacterium]MCH9616474.1 putative non-heme bromoperoxidase BpoC [Chlamydiia bacterium]MCH9629540.1 putative non-heme bromoperoxidase BpoC [Chlamydiia bacterium]
MIYHEIHGDGPELVAIAGFGCDHTNWVSVLPILSENFKVLIFDNWGSGQSPQEDKPYSIEKMADDTLELAASVGFTKPHFLGHSMGGAIVQEIGRRRPDMGKLVITCSLFKIRKAAEMIFESVMKRKMRGDDEKELFESLVPWLFHDPFLEKVSIDQMFKPTTQTLIGFRRQMQALRAFDSRPFLGDITDPTLVIGAKNDILTPAYESVFIAENIPNAELVLLDNVGHRALDENPEEFMAPILNFLL